MGSADTYDDRAIHVSNQELVEENEEYFIDTFPRTLALSTRFDNSMYQTQYI